MERRLVPPFYWAGAWLVRVLLSLLARWQVRGRERVPGRGPLVIVANHLHFIDPPILMGSLPRRILFMAKEELFHHPLAWVVKGVGAFPVRRQQLDRASFRRALSALDKGLAVGIFPEGSRSPSARLQPALLGTAFLLRHRPVPVLPVAIWGSERLNGISWIFRRPRITVSIGEPFTWTGKDGRLSREALQELTDSIMDRIAALLPEPYRGVYGGTGGG